MLDTGLSSSTSYFFLGVLLDTGFSSSASAVSSGPGSFSYRLGDGSGLRARWCFFSSHAVWGGIDKVLFLTTSVDDWSWFLGRLLSSDNHVLGMTLNHVGVTKNVTVMALSGYQ